MTWMLLRIDALSPRGWIAVGVAVFGSLAIAFGIAFAGIPQFRDRVLGVTVEPTIDGRLYPDVLSVVGEYYKRWGQVNVDCDIDSFRKAYPHVGDPGRFEDGVNREAQMLEHRCDKAHIYYTPVVAVSFDLEDYEPMRLRPNGDGFDVVVHGLERWQYPNGGPSMGEFMTTITVRPVGGEWRIVRTDEVTLGELHAQR